MSKILTLVASKSEHPVTANHFQDVSKIFEHYNLALSGDMTWLAEGKAADMRLDGQVAYPIIAHLRDYFSTSKIDFFITEAQNRRKKLLLADMDSTIVSSETLDELAQYAGIKDKIAAITARAMNGELDFHDALRERVGLLQGLPVTALMATLEETHLNLGAKVFVRTMRAHGATCVLVSGGFTFFTQKIADQCGFAFNHGNNLEIEHDKLTGQVIPPILDKFSKVEFLEFYMKDLGLEAKDCLCIGDGANDVPMLHAAGLGIGYHPKPAVAEVVKNTILYGDLSAALYAQGYKKSEFSTA